jgi:hypothetical protein
MHEHHSRESLSIQRRLGCCLSCRAEKKGQSRVRERFCTVPVRPCVTVHLLDSDSDLQGVLAPHFHLSQRSLFKSYRRRQSLIQRCFGQWKPVCHFRTVSSRQYLAPPFHTHANGTCTFYLLINVLAHISFTQTQTTIRCTIPRGPNYSSYSFPPSPPSLPFCACQRFFPQGTQIFTCDHAQRKGCSSDCFGSVMRH